MNAIIRRIRRIRRSTLCALLLMASVGCASGGGTEDASFPKPEADFAQHIDAVYTHIAAQSLPKRTPEDIKLNLPFELSAAENVPYRGKFLLFHGLNDSAYVWTDLANKLASAGFDVRAVLLPGHGSHPDAMLDISYETWLDTARAHHRLWHTDDTPMYLGGFSLGGVLATSLALDNPNTAGLLLISPAFKSQLHNLLRWSWLYNYYEDYVFGGVILEDNPIKYNSIPINSATQYFNTTRHLARKWGDQTLGMPVAMAVTDADSVVNVEHTRRLFQKRIVNADSRLMVFSSDTEQQTKSRETLHNSHYPDRRILNQSHLSVLNAPANPLFGENGRILVCNGNEYEIFFACMRATGHWYGAQHTPSPDGVPVARTTYNPDFEAVWDLAVEVFDLR